jgi:sugar O-acyltransferase (sialic acid O-acetyltransferase NeuD family)
MSVLEVVAPRINVNEDNALVVEVLATQGLSVNEGDVLFVLETTKASFEVNSSISGIVEEVLVQPGDMVDVGTTLCRFRNDQAAPGSRANEQAGRQGGDKSAGGEVVAITAKAKLRAKELGLAINLVPPFEGRIGVKDVEDFAARHGGVAEHKVVGQASRSLTTAKAVMVGAGGHAAILGDVLVGSGWDVVGALDDRVPVGTVVLPGLSVIGGDDLLGRLFDEGVRTAFVGVGGPTDAGPRRGIYERLTTAGFHLPPVVHKSASLSPDVKLGLATYVMASATIGPRCVIGSNVIINTGSVVCHDCVIEDHVHITPGAIIAGSVRIGEQSTVGMAATVLFGVTIGRNVVIHNSAAVIGNVKDNVQVTRAGTKLPND